MPKPKQRKKHYSPRPGGKAAVLSNFPVTAAMVQSLKNDLHRMLLRLRMSGVNGKDLATLVACFGQAWLLANAMADGAELRSHIEGGVKTLSEAIVQDPETAVDKAFDTLLDLIELSVQIVSLSTRGEYKSASDRLKVPGEVAFVDEFFITLAKAQLLKVQ